MGMQTVMAAPCQCTMGLVPSVLMVLPLHKTMAMSMPAANIDDHIPFLNILPFGTCKSMACPTTAALTAAKLGVYTPGPCIPMTVAPWAPGCPTVMLDKKPTLNNSSTLMCAFGGVISIKFAGQPMVQVP
ncbi:MAG: DUF4280 domain-containing protein [Alphaproteobacteria bacterium]|nr:DUF4280 domain-containing protein [Alphaproteobacteria bacterium]OJV44950.1 MAG: hypothetical protein BGO28_06005 [Alphaproteobacteria bacterium 43-37]